MAIYAIVNVDNVVENIIVWDEVSEWRPPDGRVLVKAEDVMCDIGWHHKDGAFVNPNLEQE